MKPICKISINGVDAKPEFLSRLISCEVTDKEGLSADTCRFELNNSPAAKMPPKDAIVKIWMGYSDRGMQFMGAFKVDEVTLSVFPHTMSVVAKSADLRAQMKENRERHWDNVSVGDIVKEIAGTYNLSPRVDDEVGSHIYEWFGQQGESDYHLLRRLEKRHGALFSIKDGLLIFAKKGSGKTPTGNQLTTFIVSEKNIVEGSGKITFSERAEYKEVSAHYQDREKAERVEVTSASSEKGVAVYRIGEPFADRSEAELAAKAKADDLKRQSSTFSCSVVGNPTARAGAPLRFSGAKVGIDGYEFIIKTARHQWSKAGLTTALDGELKV